MSERIDLAKSMDVANRRYYIYGPSLDSRKYTISYQPINPKTGKPWQAFRHFDNSDKGYMSANEYGSLAEAIEAIRDHTAKAGA